MGSTMLVGDDLRVDKLSSLVQDGEVYDHARSLGRKRRCVSSEDVDPQYKLFLKNLRIDGGSYASEVVGEDGVSKLIRYHQEDGSGRRIVRRCISDEDVDPQYKLFLENLREDGNSYALEVVQDDGVLELIRYHQEDSSERRIVRRCILDEDVDPQYKLFLGNLREDGNSYAQEIVSESGATELIRYHQEDGLQRRVERRPVCNDQFVDNCEKSLNLDKLGNDGNEHSGDDNGDIKYGDDSYNELGCLSDDNSHIRSVEDGDNGNEQCGDDDIDVKSVHDGDYCNERFSHDIVHVKSFDDDIRDPNSKFLMENLREDENMCAQEKFQETKLEPIRYNQNNVLPDEANLLETEPIKNTLIKHKTETENRYCLESHSPRRKSSVVNQNAESAALDPASDLENKISSKRPCLEVPNDLEEIISDTPETVRCPEVKEKPVRENNVILELFEKCRGKKSSVVKENAKMQIPNPVSSRTRGKRPHLEAHIPESITSSSLKEKMENERTLRRMKEKVKMNRPNNDKEETRGPKTLRNERSESLQRLEDLQVKKDRRVKKNVKEEAEYPYLERTDELPNKGPSPEVLHFANFGCNDFAKSDLNGNVDDETESNQTDESYQNFLSLCEIKEDYITYALQNGTPVSYDVEMIDEYVESSSDSDLIVLERDPVDGCHTSILKDSDNDLGSHLDYRVELLKDLKRPYDQEEYLKLLEDWSNQRPARGHAKNLRSGVIKTYALQGEYGKPYSLLYPDLAEIIKASNRCRSLNLLRGFFYWLKNVAHDNSFQPWRDAECLNEVPQL